MKVQCKDITYMSLHSNNQPSTTKMFVEFRKQTSAHLPIGHSFIPFDILLTVVNSHEIDSQLTVKGLFKELPYSDMGLRYHFTKLIDSGWIELEAVSTDARLKKVKPTTKLLKQFGLVASSLACYLK